MLNQQFNVFRNIIKADYPYLLEIDENSFFKSFTIVWNNLLDQHSNLSIKYYSNLDQGIIDFKFLDHYLIFCYRMANYLHIIGNTNDLADAIYYSSRIRTSTDLYFTAKIGSYFMPVHSIGAIIDSHAVYGKLLKVYDGVHIGPYNINGISAENWKHPKIGDGVTLLANSSVYGITEIGDNVIVSIGATIINENIPPNCIVMGSSPNLKILPNRTNNLDIIRDLSR